VYASLSGSRSSYRWRRKRAGYRSDDGWERLWWFSPKTTWRIYPNRSGREQNPSSRHNSGLHSAQYDFNDATLPIAAGYFAEFAERRLPID
jgi:metal-dependent amidase/aminoacylase/carboxypeptidase family protein